MCVNRGGCRCTQTIHTAPCVPPVSQSSTGALELGIAGIVREAMQDTGRSVSADTPQGVCWLVCSSAPFLGAQATMWRGFRHG